MAFSGTLLSRHGCKNHRPPNKSFRLFRFLEMSHVLGTKMVPENWKIEIKGCDLDVYIYIYIYIWLVVSNISYFPFHNMGCHPSHWQTHIFQKGGSTTNQIYIASSSSDMGGACRGLPGEADNLLDKILKILGGIFRWKTQNIQNSWAMVAMDAQRSPSCKRCVF